jgi:hypothetical protein
LPERPSGAIDRQPIGPSSDGADLIEGLRTEGAVLASFVAE